MANFENAVSKTLKWEGGFTVDTGGKTKYGISQNAYPNEDIPNLTLDRAKQLYRRDYWEPIQGDRIAAQDAAEALFDFAVNAGLSRAKSEARKALQAAGIVPGANLADSINRAGKYFAPAIGSRRISFYRDLAAANPAKYKKYLAGWEKRAKAFFQYSPLGLFLFLSLVAGGGYYYFKKSQKGKQ